MARSTCTFCGAEVDIARIRGTKENVPLELFTDSGGTAADRYRVVGHNPLEVERVAARALGAFQPDHRYDCPGHNAGR